MGQIINSRKEGEKVYLEFAADYEEYLGLKGHLENVHLFAENVVRTKTNISQRGKNSATKYFLIPTQFRKGFRFDNETSCQKIDLGDKVVFVYMVNKMKVSPSRREIRINKYQKRELENSFAA